MVRGQPSEMKTFSAVIAGVLLSLSAFGQRTPLNRAFLQSNLDGNGKAGTNFGTLRSTNFVDAATGLPLAFGGVSTNFGVISSNGITVTTQSSAGVSIVAIADAYAKQPAAAALTNLSILNASSLTNLNASELRSGFIPPARLAVTAGQSTVPRVENGSNTFDVVGGLTNRLFRQADSSLSLDPGTRRAHLDATRYSIDWKNFVLRDGTNDTLNWFSKTFPLGWNGENLTNLPVPTLQQALSNVVNLASNTYVGSFVGYGGFITNILESRVVGLLGDLDSKITTNLVLFQLRTNNASTLTNASPTNLFGAGQIPPAKLGTGSGGSSKFLREDGTFQSIPGGGDMLATNNLSDVADKGLGRTNLLVNNATNLTAGTLPDARLSANASLLGQTITRTEIDISELPDTELLFNNAGEIGTISQSAFSLAGVTPAAVSNLVALTSNNYVGTFTGNGAGLSNVVNGSGTFDYAVLTNKPPPIASVATNNASSLTNLNLVGNTITNLGGSPILTSFAGGTITIFEPNQNRPLIVADDTTFSIYSGTVASIFGNEDATTIRSPVGIGSLYLTDVDAIITGRIVGNGAGISNLQSANLVGALPAISGNAVTGVIAASGDSATGFFPSGTIEDARLSSNIPRLDAGVQTFHGSNLFSGVREYSTQMQRAEAIHFVAVPGTDYGPDDIYPAAFEIVNAGTDYLIGDVLTLANGYEVDITTTGGAGEITGISVSSDWVVSFLDWDRELAVTNHLEIQGTGAIFRVSAFTVSTWTTNASSDGLFSGNGGGLSNLQASALTGALPAIDGSALTGIGSGGTGMQTNQFTTNVVGQAIVGETRHSSIGSWTNGAPGVGVTNSPAGWTAQSGVNTNKSAFSSADGSAAAPGFRFTSDPNTGIAITGNGLAMIYDGVEAMTFTFRGPNIPAAAAIEFSGTTVTLSKVGSTLLVKGDGIVTALSTTTNGSIIRSNSVLAQPTLVGGDNWYFSSNGIPHVVSIDFSGVRRTNDLTATGGSSFDLTANHHFTSTSSNDFYGTTLFDGNVYFGPTTQIKDDAGGDVIYPSSKRLIDGAVLSIDWTNRTLNDIAGAEVLNWRNGLSVSLASIDSGYITNLFVGNFYPTNVYVTSWQAITNAWAGPTNTYTLTTYDQFYKTLTPISITNVAGYDLTNHVFSTLEITNASGSNIIVYTPASVRFDDALTAHTVYAGGKGKFYFDAGPGGTNCVVVSFGAPEVGEYITNVLTAANAVALTTATTANITNISLTPGDWDVTGVVGFDAAATTTSTYMQGGVSTTSATLGALGTYFSNPFAVATTAEDAIEVCPTVRLSLATTTTVYLVGKAGFAISTMTGFGHIRATRIK